MCKVRQSKYISRTDVAISDIYNWNKWIHVYPFWQLVVASSLIEGDFTFSIVVSLCLAVVVPFQE